MAAHVFLYVVFTPPLRGARLGEIVKVSMRTRFSQTDSQPPVCTIEQVRRTLSRFHGTECAVQLSIAGVKGNRG
jgi:hypothetical protein